MSVLWKAFCFKDQAAADAFTDPSHNLTPSQVVDIFCADLNAKGIAHTEPSDLETDEAFRDVILKHYNSPEGSAY